MKLERKWIKNFIITTNRLSECKSVKILNSEGRVHGPEILEVAKKVKHRLAESCTEEQTELLLKIASACIKGILALRNSNLLKGKGNIAKTIARMWLSYVTSASYLHAPAFYSMARRFEMHLQSIRRVKTDNFTPTDRDDGEYAYLVSSLLILKINYALQRKQCKKDILHNLQNCVCWLRHAESKGAERIGELVVTLFSKAVALSKCALSVSRKLYMQFRLTVVDLVVFQHEFGQIVSYTCTKLDRHQLMEFINEAILKFRNRCLPVAPGSYRVAGSWKGPPKFYPNWFLEIAYKAARNGLHDSAAEVLAEGNKVLHSISLSPRINKTDLSFFQAAFLLSKAAAALWSYTGGRAMEKKLNSEVLGYLSEAILKLNAIDNGCIKNLSTDSLDCFFRGVIFLDALSKASTPMDDSATGITQSRHIANINLSNKVRNKMTVALCFLAKLLGMGVVDSTWTDSTLTSALEIAYGAGVSFLNKKTACKLPALIKPVLPCLQHPKATTKDKMRITKLMYNVAFYEFKRSSIKIAMDAINMSLKAMGNQLKEYDLSYWDFTKVLTFRATVLIFQARAHGESPRHKDSICNSAIDSCLQALKWNPSNKEAISQLVRASSYLASWTDKDERPIKAIIKKISLMERASWLLYELHREFQGYPDQIGDLGILEALLDLHSAEKQPAERARVLVSFAQTARRGLVGHDPVQLLNDALKLYDRVLNRPACYDDDVAFALSWLGICQRANQKENNKQALEEASEEGDQTWLDNIYKALRMWARLIDSPTKVQKQLFRDFQITASQLLTLADLFSIMSLNAQQIHILKMLTRLTERFSEHPSAIAHRVRVLGRIGLSFCSLGYNGKAAPYFQRADESVNIIPVQFRSNARNQLRVMKAQYNFSLGKLKRASHLVKKVILPVYQSNPLSAEARTTLVEIGSFGVATLRGSRPLKDQANNAFKLFVELGGLSLKKEKNGGKQVTATYTKLVDNVTKNPLNLTKVQWHYSEFKFVDQFLMSLRSLATIHELEGDSRTAVHLLGIGLKAAKALGALGIKRQFLLDLASVEAKKFNWTSSINYRNELERSIKVLPGIELTSVQSKVCEGDFRLRKKEFDLANDCFESAIVMLNVVGRVNHLDAFDHKTSEFPISNRGDTMELEEREESHFVSSSEVDITPEKKIPLIRLMCRIRRKISSCLLGLGNEKKCLQQLEKVMVYRSHLSPIEMCKLWLLRGKAMVLRLSREGLLDAVWDPQTPAVDSVVERMVAKASRWLSHAWVQSIALPFPVPRLHKEINTALALCVGNRDPQVAAFLIFDNLGISAREAVTARSRKSPNIDPKREALFQPPSIESSSSQDHYQVIKAKALEFFMVKGKKLPQLWTSIAIVHHSETNQLLVARLRDGDQPYLVKLKPRGKLSLSDYFAEFNRIIKESDVTITNAPKCQEREDRTVWWATRYKLDEDLKTLLRSMEEDVFYCWKGILLGILPLDKTHDMKIAEVKANLASFIDFKNPVLKTRFDILINAVPALSKIQMRDALRELLRKPSSEKEAFEVLETLYIKKQPVLKTRGTTGDRKRKRHRIMVNLEDACVRSHIFLSVSKGLAQFPWESLPMFLTEKYIQPICRVPALEFAIERLPKKGLGKSIILRKKQVFYILDPAANLKKSREKFLPIFVDGHGWRGIVAKAPTTEEYERSLVNHSMMIFIGHGSGELYFSASKVEKIKVKAITFLMGCSSGKLRYDGIYVPRGVALSYMIGEAPLVITNLWDVTDRDIDKYFDRLLVRVLEGDDIATAVARTRSVCKLPYLNGAAPCCYGITKRFKVCASSKRVLDSPPDIQQKKQKFFYF